MPGRADAIVFAQRHTPLTRRAALQAAAGAAVGSLLACSSGSDAPPAAATRSWRMGFSGLPPRNTFADAIRTIDTWSPRADIAAIHEELPWTEMLATGTSADTILQRDKVGLVNYYRGKGLQLMFMADLTDGLSRAQEAPQLRALGRSIAEPAVQQVYRNYVLAVARLLQPEYLGLAAETNLIRAAAPAIYPSVKQAATAAAADLRAAAFPGVVFISVQVETAWGRLGGTGPYVGITTDRADFSFAQMLGLSSYPYFGYTTPEDIPADYYTRLQQGTTALPLMVVEGGWPSMGVSAIVSSPALQARYVTRQAALLDSVAARGWIQLEFVDIDLASFPPPLPANLPLFATLGLVDSNYAAKPALAQWDALFARPR